MPLTLRWPGVLPAGRTSAQLAITLMLSLGSGDSLWDSMDAVRSFAGEQPEVAVVEPEARAALARFDDTVRHYEMLADPGTAR